MTHTAAEDEFWHGIWWLPDFHGGLRSAETREYVAEIKRLRAEVARLTQQQETAHAHAV